MFYKLKSRLQTCFHKNITCRTYKIDLKKNQKTSTKGIATKIYLDIFSQALVFSKFFRSIFAKNKVLNIFTKAVIINDGIIIITRAATEKRSAAFSGSPFEEFAFKIKKEASDIITVIIPKNKLTNLRNKCFLIIDIFIDSILKSLSC